MSSSKESSLGFPGGSVVKNPPANVQEQVQSLVWEDPLEEGMETYSNCLENPHGQRTLVGYSPWGHKELNTTERLSTHTHSVHYVSHTGQALHINELI